MSEKDELDVFPNNTKIITINNLISYKLREAVYISLDYYDDEVIATHYDTESYASGKTEFDAIEGLKYEIEDLFNHLIETADENLSPRFQRWKKFLLSFLLETKIDYYSKFVDFLRLYNEKFSKVEKIPTLEEFISVIH